MGLGDLTSTVLTKYQADASDHIRELEKLKGKITATQQADLDAAKSREDTYSKWLGGLANVNQALELGGKVVSFLGDAWKEYADDVKLAAAIGTTSIEGLSKASLGLRTEQELMEFAAKAQNGVIKANQAQMETAEKAMIALTRAGFDQHEVTKKVTDAMVSLKTGGLEDLGITVRKGTTDLETYTNVMVALGAKAQGVDEASLTASEGMQRMGVSVSDSIDNIKSAIGELVQAMAPLIQALATSVELIAKAAGGVLQSTGDPMENAEKYLEMRGRLARALEDGGSIQDMIATYEAGGKRTLVGARDRWNDDELGGMDEGAYASFMRKRGLMGDQGKPADKLDWGKWGGMGAATAGGDFVDSLGDRIAAAIKEANGAVKDSEFKNWRNPLQGADEMRASGGLPQGDAFNEMRSGLEKLQADLRAPAERQQSFLESNFGKLEDFNAYSTAFGMLTGSVTSAMDAWIDGSMGAGEAIKKFLAGAMKGLATSMAVEALKHGAYALGSLAFGDVAGAAAHGLAAAEFGGVAVAAAVAAKELGGGGGSTAKSGGGASAGSSGGRSSGGSVSSPGSGKHESEGLQKESVVIVYADPFADGSPTQRRQNAERFAQRALAQSSARR